MNETITTSTPFTFKLNDGMIILPFTATLANGEKKTLRIPLPASLIVEQADRLTITWNKQGFEKFLDEFKTSWTRMSYKFGSQPKMENLEVITR